jgi:hypothetical protein
VIVLTMATARVIFEVQNRRPSADAMSITVVGHQWWWEPGSIAFLLPAVLLAMRLFERQSGMHRKPSSALVRP